MIGIEQDILPKLGFLGVGWIGKNRLEALTSQRLTEQVYIHDPDPSSIQDILQALPSPKVKESSTDVLQEEVDGIVIAAPSALHAKRAIQALENGQAVFCQKPLGRNLAETKAVVYQAQQSNKLLAVDYSYR